MDKNEVLKILETAKDKNGEVPMRLVRQAFEKLPEPCEDMISRQEAIDELESYGEFIAINIIKELPTAQPEPSQIARDIATIIENEQDMRVILAQPQRRRGRWEITDAYPHNVYCSECHKRFAQTHWAVWEDGSLPRNYCPNCGSYNGGEE